MPTGNVGANSAVTGSSTFTIQCGSTAGWVVHNIYVSAAANVAKTDGTHSIPIKSLVAGEWLSNIAIHISSAVYIVITDTSGSTNNMGWDGYEVAQLRVKPGFREAFGAYDYYIQTDASGAYTAYDKSGNVAATNTTPDIWALLNSIDAIVGTLSYTRVFIVAGAYTGSAHFEPSENHGFIIEGDGSSTAANYFLASGGTVLNWTGTTGSAIDCSANWQQNPGDILRLYFLQIIATTASSYIINASSAAGSEFYMVEINGKATSSAISGSTGIYMGSNLNSSYHRVVKCLFTNVQYGIHCSADELVVEDTSFIVNSGGTAGIWIDGGVHHHVRGAISNNITSLVKDDRAINSEGLLTMEQLTVEGGVTYKNSTGAYYVFLGGGAATSAGALGMSTNVAIQNKTLVTATLGSDQTNATTGLESTGLGVHFASAANIDYGGNNTTRFKVRVVIYGNDGTATDGMKFAIYRNTSGIPSANTAVGGDTQLTITPTLVQGATGGLDQCVVLEYFDTGLTEGDDYYYYLAFASVTAGTTTARAAGSYMEGLPI